MRPLGEQHLDVNFDVVFVHESSHISWCHPPLPVYEGCVWQGLDSAPLRCRIIPQQHSVGHVGFGKEWLYSIRYGAATCAGAPGQLTQLPQFGK